MAVSTLIRTHDERTGMANQEVTLRLLELTALLLPVVAVVVQVLLNRAGELRVEVAGRGFDYRVVGLTGGGFVIALLVGTAVLLVTELRVQVGVSLTGSRIGYAMLLLTSALVGLGLLLLALTWGSAEAAGTGGDAG